MQKFHSQYLELKLVIELTLSLNSSEKVEEKEIYILHRKIIEENLNFIQNETQNKLAKFISSPVYNSCCEKRKSIVEWLNKINHQAGFSDETFFQCLEILDKILIIYEFKLRFDDILLISLDSLLVSTKINETFSFQMHILENIFENNKISKDTLISTEMLILTKLKYKIPNNYFVEYIHILNLLKFGKEDTFYKRVALKYSSSLKNLHFS